MDKAGFINYLENKDFKAGTICKHVKYVSDFFAKVKKEDLQITKPDVLKFLEYLKNEKELNNRYRSIYLVSLNHYFSFLYQAEKIAKNPCLFLKIRGIYKKKLHKIYTIGEMDEVFDNYYQVFVRNFDDSHYRTEAQRKHSALSRERNTLILSILINQGVTTGEILKMETGDVNLMKATIKIRGGNMLKDRVLPLKNTQIGLFINYLQNIRPQILEYHKTESNYLFLALSDMGKSPKKKALKADLNLTYFVFYLLAKQVKSIDRQFIKLQQFRASLITFWLKTQGLRKAQYLAGHRYIFTTEKYVNNNLDGLIEDITNLHPFDF